MSKGKKGKHAHFDNVALINHVFERGRSAGQTFSSKACAVWIVMALREEGFGIKRLQRVLDSVNKYARLTASGEIDIEAQRDHIRKTTGINIRYEAADDILYEVDSAEVEDFEFEEE